MNRSKFLEKARSVHFDVCIIGGGATGAGTALEASVRGMQTILIEKEDFAAGTSSKSTKLIHGGVRYLEQAVKKLSYGQYAMVRKGLHERKYLLDMAPHVTRPLALLTPCRSLVSGIYYYIGLKLYDWISGRSTIGNSRLLTKSKASQLIPTLDKKSLYNAVLYYDGQMDDQRLNLAIVQTAAEQGAVCLNHCKAVGFIKHASGALQQLQAIDTITGEPLIISANLFINACGPFADAIRLMANEKLKPRIRVSKGVHLLLPKAVMPADTGLLIPETRDGRVIFLLPYGNYVLAGTTDDEVALTEKDFGPNKLDVDYILSYVNEYLGTQATADQVTAGFGGLRPLVAADENDTKDLVRDHFVEVDQQSGLISILGGKWTTYRLMAKDTVNAAAAVAGKPQAAQAAVVKLVGSQHYRKSLAEELVALSNCAPDIAVHLVARYGDRALVIGALMQKDPTSTSRFVNNLPYTKAELLYVMQHEMACTVKDVLSRRWGIELTNWQQTLQLIPLVGAFMATYFGWTENEIKHYVEGYESEINSMILQMSR